MADSLWRGGSLSRAALMLLRSGAVIASAMIVCGTVIGASSLAQAPAPPTVPAPPAAQVPAHYVESLQALATPPSLRAFHDLLGSEPHVAGTPGDERQIERIAGAFKEMGLAVRIEPFWAMLPAPIEAELEIVETPGTQAPPAAGQRRGVIPLPIRERGLLEDPATEHPELSYGWNAYSGSGEVTAGVVYANRGTKADFERLAQMKIDCTGHIVLIRYGGIFRGSKVRNAQEAGAAAVLLYTDPADSGSVRGATWPDGGWANDLCIQRGSVAALDWPGDPLTPLVPAVPGVEHRDPDSVGLPRIPVQPIGYAAAAQIMSRMRGTVINSEDPWHGGMPIEYRIGGGASGGAGDNADAANIAGVTLRLKVIQDREIRQSANIIAVLPGSVWPEQAVIVGCHHDAWGFGAADPLAGTIVLMEMARTMSELAQKGQRPLRSVIFAAWGAEEFGIIGSVEWVEAHRDSIAKQAVAYLNLDMAAMGPNLHASASPSLRSIVSRATGCASVGDPGGGSDHVGFLHHLAIPCVGLGGHGSAGDSYHSNYDTLEWYRRVVGDDYEPAMMITRAGLGIVGGLAIDRVLSLRTSEIGEAIVRWAKALKERTTDERALRALDSLVLRGESIAEQGARVDPRLAALSESLPLLALDRCAELNRLLMGLDRAWYDPVGLTLRPWYRNLSLACDRESAYGAEALPLLVEALALGNAEAIDTAMERTADAIDRIAETLQEIDDSIEGLRREQDRPELSDETPDMSPDQP